MIPTVVSAHIPSPTRSNELPTSSSPKRRNYAFFQPSPPSSLNSRGSFFSPRNAKTRQQGHDGATEKNSAIVFQSSPSPHQMINSGDLCFFDDLTPYIPTKLARFCFLWLNDDSARDAASHSSLCGSSISDRSIWINDKYVEFSWKTEVATACAAPGTTRRKSVLHARRQTTNPSFFRGSSPLSLSVATEAPREMVPHYHRIGFGYFLWMFLGTSHETHMSKAAEIFAMLHTRQLDQERCSRKKESGEEGGGEEAGHASLPSRAALSDGRPAFCIYQGIKRQGEDFLEVEVVESSDAPFRVELKARVQRVASADNRSGMNDNHNSDKIETKVTRRRNTLTKCSAFADDLKYKRPYFYEIDEEDLRLFLFDKSDYSVDHFGVCMPSNRPPSEYDNTFFGKVMHGLVFDVESNSLGVDFIDRLRIEKYYKEVVSATEKVLISKVFDERKIEVALRESVAKMAEYDRLNNLPMDTLTLSGIYRSFINDKNVVSTPPDREPRFGEESFGVNMLMFPSHDDVESAYVKSFNAEISRQWAIREKEKEIRMEIFMSKFSLVAVEDCSTPEDHHLFDKAPMPLYSTFSTKTSKFLYGLVTRSSPASVAQIRESLSTSVSTRSMSMKSNIISMLLRTSGLSEHLTTCGHHSLEQIANSCNFVHLPKGGVVLAKEGEYFDCCFIVLTGSVNIVKWRTKATTKEHEEGHVRRVKSGAKRYATTKVARKGVFVGNDVLRGKHSWRADVTVGDEGASLCLLPVQLLLKFVGKFNSNAKSFMKCFWKFCHIWTHTAIRHEKKSVHHFDDGLSDKLEHVESSSYFFRPGDSSCGTESEVTGRAVSQQDLASPSTSATVVISTEEMQRWLTDRACIRCFRPGEVIFEQGSESHLLSVVMLGECSYVRQLTISRGEQLPPSLVEVELGVNLFPGHFALEVSTEQFRNLASDKKKIKSYRNEHAKLQEAFDKWEKSMGMNATHGKTKNTIIDNMRFGFSMLSASTSAAATSECEDAPADRSTADLEAETDGVLQHHKRSGIFKKTFLTSLADHDFTLTTAVYGSHRNSLIAKTFCEICVLPLADISKCPPVFFDLLVDKFKEKYQRVLMTDHELKSAYVASLKSDISQTQAKLDVFNEMKRHRPRQTTVEKQDTFEANQRRLEEELDAIKVRLAQVCAAPPRSCVTSSSSGQN